MRAFDGSVYCGFSILCDSGEMKFNKCFINEMARALKEYCFNYFDRQLRFMKALSDETRLRILRIIYRDKASTQSLAKELNISEAGVSKHLLMK